MTSEDVLQEFRSLIGSQIELVADGDEKFIIYTPFMFDDGDHFMVVLKRVDDLWHFTDEGHTLVHLSYNGFKLSPSRQKALDRALSAGDVDNKGGELVRQVTYDVQCGELLFGYLQTLTKVSELSKWSRENVRSTFIDDFRGLLEATIPEERISFDYTDQERDPEGKYVVDCKVNGMARPLLIFAVNSDLKCKDATIALHQFTVWGKEFESMAIFEDQVKIPRLTLARFSDVVGKQFSSIGIAEDIASYLTSHVTGLDKLS